MFLNQIREEINPRLKVLTKSKEKVKRIILFDY